jgi:hypothetical protein
VSFIQREIDRIGTHLVSLLDNNDEMSAKYKELYAAQQALAWALEPGGTASPYEVIMGNAAASKGCSAPHHPPSS